MKTPVYNPGPNTMYIAGRAIIAGETRLFDADQVPLHLHPGYTPVAPPDPPPPVWSPHELLQQPVKVVIAAIPTLTVEQLEQIEAAEAAGQQRKTLLTEVTAALLAAASAKVG